MPAPVEIREIPCPNTHAHFKLALIADAQEYPEYVGKLSQQMKDEQVTALLSAGDMVQEGRIFQDWLDYFNVTNILGGSVLTLPAIGNHEYRSDSSNRLWSHFFQKPSTFAYYSFYIGDAHIIVLNSGFEDEPIVMLPQLPWLEAQLLMPAKWKIVMFHHAVYSKGTFNSPLSPLKEFEHLQNLYVPMFELHGVDLVLTGHTHIYERSLKNGIQYVVAGPAGGKMGFYGAENKYSLFSSRDRTVTYLDVSEKELRIRTKNIDGSIIDGVNLSK
jgi:predicted phosphodiesterase